MGRVARAQTPPEAAPTASQAVSPEAASAVGPTVSAEAPRRVEGVAPAPGAAQAVEGPVQSVVVRGREPIRAAGDVAITVGRLGEVPRANAAGMLQLAPGVFLANGLGDGHAEQVFLRGFDARAGQDLEFTVNGVPLNEPGHPHGHGFADTHAIIPELVESLRVIEGPFDPRQGDFAVAGSAAYTLRAPVRGVTVQQRYGSFNTWRTMASWAPEGQSAGTFAAVELGGSDGFGVNRASERMALNAQYEGRLSGGAVWRALVLSYGTRYRSAGVLRLDDVTRGAVDFYGTLDPTQGGEVTRHLVSGELDTGTFKLLSWASLRSYRLRENFTGQLLDVQRAWQSPHGQRGDGIDQSADSVDVGARASTRMRTSFRSLTQSLELGVYARHSSVDASQTRLRSRSDIAYALDYALDSRLSNLGAYADAELRPLRWVTLRGGVRADFYQYNVLDACATGGTSVRGVALDTACPSADRYGYRDPATRRASGGLAIQPRATLTLGPWHGLSAALAIGRGARSADPVYLGNDQLLPYSPVTAYEGGLLFERRTPGWQLQARGLGFYTQLGQDLIFDETQGRNALATGTSRYGALATARLSTAWVDVSAHVTWAQAVYDDTGLRVPYVPELVARLDGAVQHALPAMIRGRRLVASGALGVSFIGPRPLPFNERGDAVFTVDANASLRWSYLALGLIAQNVFDARYQWSQYNYVSDFGSRDFPTLVAARHFTAGTPRTLLLTVTLYLGETARRHGAPSPHGAAAPQPEPS